MLAPLDAKCYETHIHILDQELLMSNHAPTIVFGLYH